MNTKFKILNNVWGYLHSDISRKDEIIYVEFLSEPYNNITDCFPLENEERVHLTITNASGMHDVPSKIEIVNVLSIEEENSILKLIVSRNNVENSLRYSFNGGAVVYLSITRDAINSKVNLDESLNVSSKITDEDANIDQSGDFETSFLRISEDSNEKVIIFSDNL